MLIEVPVWGHAVPHRYCFLSQNVMRKLFPIALCMLLFAACNPNAPEPKGTKVSFKESDELFPNPERGLMAQIYYTSDDLEKHTTAQGINTNRTGAAYLTVYLHSYYLTDYMESDIPQAFLDRLETNMQALRGGGGKVVLRFSYKSNMDAKDKPWDANPEWVHRHIDQLAPYLQKNADVILCVQCGFIGSWGEWYYTTGFKMNPTKDEEFEPRWQVLEHLLSVLPTDRQVALRTPTFKMKYLEMRGMEAAPLTAGEAFQSTNKARIAGHNDCFVSSGSDVGTYKNNGDRDFWAEDTKYTFMGGETCEKSSYSNGEHAISEMEKFHWTYLNKDYREEVTRMWKNDGSYDIIMHRLGYRLVLDKAILTSSPKAGQKYEAYFQLHNAGFASPINKRGLELIFVKANDPTKKYVYEQKEDPRFWLPGEHTFTLTCSLDAAMQGEYKLYLNLPDPYPSLHDDPRYSIRMANKDIWEEQTGYNYIANVLIN